MLDFSQTNTMQLVVLCRQERSRDYLQKNPQFSPACVELFRRAFAGDQVAWTAIHELFTPLMQRWIGVQQQIHPEDVLQEALIAYHRYAPGLSNLLATQDLSPALEYLRKCVKTALLTILRRNKQTRQAVPLDLVSNIVSDNSAIEQTDLRLTLEQKFAELLESEQERLVFYLRFECNLGPQQIFAENQNSFADYQEVATIIQRLTRRLRKDEVLQNLGNARQKSVKSALLEIRLMKNVRGLETQKDQMNMDRACNYQEEVLLDYITGLASTELCAAIEQSPACLQAAQALLNDIGPWLSHLQHFSCPDVERLVAYQQRQLKNAEYLVLDKHVKHCPHCRDEIALLIAIDAIPFTPPPTVVRRIIEALLLPPLALPQPVRGELHVYQTPQVYIHVSTRQSAGKARAWMVRGQLRTLERVLFTDVEAVGLQNLDDPDTVEAFTTLDSNGFFVFKGLMTGNYRLRVLTTEEEVVIRKLVVGIDE